MGKLLASLGLSFLLGCSSSSVLETRVDDDLASGGVAVSIGGGSTTSAGTSLAMSTAGYQNTKGNNLCKPTELEEVLDNYNRLKRRVDRGKLRTSSMKRLYDLASQCAGTAADLMAECSTGKKYGEIGPLGYAFINLVFGIYKEKVLRYAETAVLLLTEVEIQQMERRGDIRNVKYFIGSFD